LSHLEAKIGYRFVDRGLLRRSLTHSSAAGADPNAVSNEHLEFLGDRVLGLIIADALYRDYAGDPVGAWATRFTTWVCRETLAEIALAVDLPRHMRMSKGEEEGGGRTNPGILADACEALIAAIYLDGGLPAAAAFVLTWWQPWLQRAGVPHKDAKTKLQEWAQARGLPLPAYSEVSRNGPAHAPSFVIEVVVEGLEPARGQGPSKRIAEHDAARNMLERVDRQQAPGRSRDPSGWSGSRHGPPG
jgi:ribonuclease-3